MLLLSSNWQRPSLCSHLLINPGLFFSPMNEKRRKGCEYLHFQQFMGKKRKKETFYASSLEPKACLHFLMLFWCLFAQHQKSRQTVSRGQKQMILFPMVSHPTSKRLCFSAPLPKFIFPFFTLLQVFLSFWPTKLQFVVG